MIGVLFILEEMLMAKPNEKESQKVIQGKRRKIIDWKNRPKTCTDVGEGYFEINTIQTFPNVEDTGGDAYASEN